MQAKVTVPWERSAALNRITPHDVWSEAARTALNHRAQVRPRHHLCWRLGSASRLGPSSNTRPHLGVGQAPDQRGTTQSPFPTCGINEICWSAGECFVSRRRLQPLLSKLKSVREFVK